MNDPSTWRFAVTPDPSLCLQPSLNPRTGAARPQIRQRFRSSTRFLVAFYTRCSLPELLIQDSFDLIRFTESTCRFLNASHRPRVKSRATKNLQQRRDKYGCQNHVASQHRFSRDLAQRYLAWDFYSPGQVACKSQQSRPTNIRQIARLEPIHKSKR